jgi:1-acyl-sn-glycerol-3-phosphate acyltransferase
LAEQLRQGKKMNVIVTPEGTRKKVKKWRTGFYYLALEANVPIIPCYIDYKHKRGGYGPPIYPTGDREYDFQQIRSFYENNDFEGKYPEQGSYNLVP